MYKLLAFLLCVFPLLASTQTGIQINGGQLKIMQQTQLYVDGDTNAHMLIQKNSKLLLDGRLQIEGNLTNHSYPNLPNSFLGSSQLYLIGNAPQTISGDSSIRIENMYINNSSDSTIYLNTNLHIIDTLTLVNSVIFIENDTLFFEEKASSKTDNGDIAKHSSHINGTIAKTGFTDFTFPSGNTNFFRPLKLTNITDTATFIVSYRDNDPFTDGYNIINYDDSLQYVSNCEYWIVSTLDPEGASIHLSWDSQVSCPVGPTNDIRIVRWDGSKWVNEGGYTNSTSIDTGWIYSNPISSFSPITLGSLSSEPLPIELLSFTVSCSKNGSLLEWSTLSEINNDYFYILRSTDLTNFDTIANIKGKGFSNTLQNYSYLDSKANINNYYLLVQKDFDGNTSHSMVTHSLCEPEGEYIRFLDKNTIEIAIWAEKGDSYEMNIFNGDAKLVKIQKGILSKGINTLKFDISILAPGNYFIHINNKYRIKSMKIIKQ